ncbi:MAG TPA: hypothetical protein VF788_17095, partial [Pseudonocardiaceae bacterium]
EVRGDRMAPRGPVAPAVRACPGVREVREDRGAQWGPAHRAPRAGPCHPEAPAPQAYRVRLAGLARPVGPVRPGERVCWPLVGQRRWQ